MGLPSVLPGSQQAIRVVTAPLRINGSEIGKKPSRLYASTSYGDELSSIVQTVDRVFGTRRSSPTWEWGRLVNKRRARHDRSGDDRGNRRLRKRARGRSGGRTQNVSASASDASGLEASRGGE